MSTFQEALKARLEAAWFGKAEPPVERVEFERDADGRIITRRKGHEYVQWGMTGSFTDVCRLCRAEWTCFDWNKPETEPGPCPGPAGAR